MSKIEPSFRILEIRTGLAASPPGTEAQTADDPGPIGVVGKVYRVKIFEGPGAAPVAQQLVTALYELEVPENEIAQALANLPAVQAADKAMVDC
jgi:hypothetical protein